MNKYKANYTVVIRPRPFDPARNGTIPAGQFCYSSRQEHVKNPRTGKLSMWAELETGGFVCIHDGDSLFLELVENSIPPKVEEQPAEPALMAALKEAQAAIEKAIRLL